MKTIPIKVLEQVAGSLSRPSKMPGYGYGLPALTSCRVGTALAAVEGSVCASCYACKGHYTLENVEKAQKFRMKTINNPSWVSAMVAMIGSKKIKHFRWHDSGDLLHVKHMAKICEVCAQLPDFHFWLPTQERLIIKEFLDGGGVIPENLIVRLSTPMIDDAPHTISGLPTSSVHKDKPPHGYPCPAHVQGNKCGECRACWNKDIPNVSYEYH